MIYRVLTAHRASIQKLQDTSLLPWEDVLETSEFFTDIERENHNYNTFRTRLELEWARNGLENINKRDEQKKDSFDPEDADPDLAILSSEGLTVQQIADKDKDVEKLLDTETKEINLPSIDIKVIKKLYLDSKSRREKEIANAGKKEKENPAVKEEPYFTSDDVRAYMVLGITAKPESKSKE